MTDRQIVYPGALPADTDILGLQRDIMIAIGYLAQAALGTGTVVWGLAGSQTTVPGMTINVGPGAIASLATVDATAFGSLASDSNPLVKIGINEAATSFTLTAPATSGQSINYLIEAAFLESDGSPGGAAILQCQQSILTLPRPVEQRNGAEYPAAATVLVAVEGGRCCHHGHPDHAGGR